MSAPRVQVNLPATLCGPLLELAKLCKEASDEQKIEVRSRPRASDATRSVMQPRRAQLWPRLRAALALALQEIYKLMEAVRAANVITFHCRACQCSRPRSLQDSYPRFKASKDFLECFRSVTQRQDPCCRCTHSAAPQCRARYAVQRRPQAVRANAAPPPQGLHGLTQGLSHAAVAPKPLHLVRSEVRSRQPRSTAKCVRSARCRCRALFCSLVRARAGMSVDLAAASGRAAGSVDLSSAFSPQSNVLSIPGSVMPDHNSDE